MIYSLSAAKLIDYGLRALSESHGHWVKRQEGKAWTQQEITLKEFQEAIPQIVEGIESRGIGIVPRAFNSTPTFVNYFQTAALGAVAIALLDLTAAVNRVGKSLEGIRDELAIANVARVQGWGDGGFGSHVHRWVRREMDTSRPGAERHFFYLWHPDDDWHPEFERRQTAEPLGPEFGGYHHDLPTICLRMRADREALIATTDYGRTAVLHLLVPTYYPLVIDHPIAFADELLPLVITAQRHRSTDLVWFDLREIRPRLRLHNISILPEIYNLAITGGCVAFVGSVIGAATCAVASAAFPPCAPVAALIGESLCTVGAGSWVTSFAGGVYHSVTERTVQVLGDSIFLA